MQTLRFSHRWDVKRPLMTFLPAYTRISSFSLTALDGFVSRCLNTTVAVTTPSYNKYQQQPRRTSWCSPRVLLQQGCMCHQKAWVSWSSSRSSSSSSSRNHHVRMKDRNDHEESSVNAGTNRSKLLPKLPVPKVEDTLTKYLAVLSTVLSPHELHVTTRRVLEFMTPGGGADNLQAYLLKRRGAVDNWVYNWWLHDMYLNIRLPLPINVNPGLLLRQQHFANRTQYLRYAARLLRALLDYKGMVDSGSLPVEMVDGGTRPLSMDQHHTVLSTSRRPALPADQLITDRHHAHTPPCIIVACRDQFYRVDVEQDGVGLSEGELYSQLCKVMTAAQHHTAGSPPVGILTTLDRSTWAEAREKLAADPGNRQNLEAMEDALLLLCLDKVSRGSFVKPSTAATGAGTTVVGDLTAAPEAEEEEERLDGAHYVLHGGGTTLNSCNRWFDKSNQLMVSEDGASGINNEHSVAEASVPFHLAMHLKKYCDSQAGCEEGEAEQESRCLRDPVWLTWTTTSEIDTYIDRAKDIMDRSVRNIDICIHGFKEFGSEFLKSHSVSPDAFVQLALQLTYYRMHGRMAMTYESATLRRFRKGRVDNIRANTPAALAWVQAMCGEGQATAAQKQALFKTAAEWQKKYMTETVSGFGLDCHMIGLREAARDLNVLESIPLFSDPAFQRMFHFHMSTSQVPNSESSPGYYGPTAPDGYGIPYSIFPDHTNFVVTSFRDCAETDSQRFMTCLGSCFQEMRDTCLQSE